MLLVTLSNQPTNKRATLRYTSMLLVTLHNQPPTATLRYTSMLLVALGNQPTNKRATLGYTSMLLVTLSNQPTNKRATLGYTSMFCWEGKQPRQQTEKKPHVACLPRYRCSCCCCSSTADLFCVVLLSKAKCCEINVVISVLVSTRLLLSSVVRCCVCWAVYAVVLLFKTKCLWDQCGVFLSQCLYIYHSL